MAPKSRDLEDYFPFGPIFSGYVSFWEGIWAKYYMYGKLTYINPTNQTHVRKYTWMVIIPKPECCRQSPPFAVTFICRLLEFAHEIFCFEGFPPFISNLRKVTISLIYFAA